MPHLVENRLLPYAALALCVAAGLPAEAGAPQIQARSQHSSSQQLPSQQSPSQQLPSAAPPESGSDPFRASMEARRQRMQSDERYRRLVNDTEKLLALSNELKQDIDKSTKNELSLDVVRKAAEIEKLAHEVKERMRS